MTEIAAGTRVRYTDGRTAVVRYSGATNFSSGNWIGIELEDDTGKNDGSVKGQRYFTCAPAHGMFVRPDTVSRMVEETLPLAEEPPGGKSFNGIEKRSRQSIMSAEAARKRQSLMGSGVSRSMSTNRQSLRSTAKSPTKLVNSQRNSFDQASSRTSSPPTTARTSDSSTKSRLSVSARPSMGPPPAPGSKAQSRLSLAGPPGRARSTDSSSTRAARSSVRPSMLLVDRPSLQKRREKSQARSMASDEASTSSPMVADDDEERLSSLSRDSGAKVGGQDAAATSPLSPPLVETKNEEALKSVNGLNAHHTAQKAAPITANKELEQMKAKYAIMERKRMEDRDKLKAVDTVREERDKFENTMQKLQRKCQAQSQEISDWRKQLRESEAKVEEIERADAERGTELEMAALDKEMAEERLEGVTDELDKLKERFDELQLESEIVRDENKELTSGMSSEERSSAGWVQMEKENQRLRDALVALRDMTQETEAGLKTHLRELEQDLSGVEGLKSEHDKAKSDLATSRNTIQTLKENLDAADNQELLVSELTEAKDALVERVDSLSQALEMLKVEVEYHQEMRKDAEEAERLVQDNLDAVQAVARQRHREVLHRDEVITDRNTTLLKFERVVAGLQAELRDVQVSRQMSEAETKELNATSRDMMDLNRRLRDSAAQTRAKQVDVELLRIKAEDTALHLSILEHFVLESFRSESAQVLVMLRFKRIASKADLLRGVIAPDKSSSVETGQDQVFFAFDMMEKLQWVALCCSRSYNFMKGCTADDFAKFRDALPELEPVERSVDTLVDAARRSDLDCGRSVEDFQRMLPLLSDLADKTIPSSPAILVEVITGRLKMAWTCSEIGALQLDSIKDFVQIKALQDEGDDDSLHFTEKANRLGERCRMGAVMAAKVLRSVEENRDRSMTVIEEFSDTFERAESIAMDLSKFVRSIGQGLATLVDDDISGNGTFTFADASTVLQALSRDRAEQSSNQLSDMPDALAVIAGLVSELDHQLESASNLVSNLSNWSEFERHPAPWILRARALFEQKMVDPQMEEHLQKAQNEAREKTFALNLKDKEIEEQSLKIEFLGARSKGLKENAATLQKLENSLADAAAQRDAAKAELETIMKEKRELSSKHDEARTKLAAINENDTMGDGTTFGAVDRHASLKLSVEMESMGEEISSLQSAIRFLKAENHRLQHPSLGGSSVATANQAWLAANRLRTSDCEGGKRGNLASASASVSVSASAHEAKDIFNTLRQAAATLKPLQLQPLLNSPAPHSLGDARHSSSADSKTKKPNPSSWRPIKQTPRYIVSRQREDLESWIQWKDDLVRRTVPGPMQQSPSRRYRLPL